MSYKCAFSSIALHKMRTSRILAVDFAKPALILCNENIGVRYAGHSHWQNIKKTKETKDLAKCKAYSGFVRLLRKEVFRASSDPKLNPKLASIISQAQAINMPMSTINKAIKRSEYLKKNPLRQYLTYRGSNGVIYILEIQSEDLGRTRMELNSIMRKHNIGKGDANLKSLFNAKCHVVAKPPENIPNPEEATVEDAIEVGAEEVEPVEELPGYFKFIGEEPEMNIIKSKLEKKNYTIESADPYYIPKSPVELSEEDSEKLYELLQILEEHDDVDKVIVNVE